MLGQYKGLESLVCRLFNRRTSVEISSKTFHRKKTVEYAIEKCAKILLLLDVSVIQPDNDERCGRKKTEGDGRDEDEWILSEGLAKGVQLHANREFARTKPTTGIYGWQTFWRVENIVIYVFS